SRAADPYSCARAGSALRTSPRSSAPRPRPPTRRPRARPAHSNRITRRSGRCASPLRPYRAERRVAACCPSVLAPRATPPSRGYRRLRTRGATGTISTPTCARSIRRAATRSGSRSRRARLSGWRYATGLRAPAPASGEQRFLASCEPREVVQRYQVGVDAPHDSLAQERLVLGGVEMLEPLLVDAIHPAQARRTACEGCLQRESLEQRIVRENRAQLACELDIGLVVPQELLDRSPGGQR